MKGAIIITLKNKKTKNHKETNEDAQSGGRIVEEKGTPKCPVAIIKLYLSKLNNNNEFLWQKPLKLCSGFDNSSSWYANQKVGKNKIGSFMKIISKKCHLTSTFTNHCLRSTVCTILGNAGYGDIDIMSISNHRSISSLGIYKRTSVNKKVNMANKLNEIAGISCVESDPISKFSSLPSIDQPPTDSAFDFELDWDD